MIRVLGFGNSLTAGTPGYDSEHGWGDPKSQYGYWIIELAKENGWDNIIFDNSGIPGELARWMPNRLNRLLQDSNYTYAIILAGSNDIGWQDNPKQIMHYLKELWGIALENGIKVIACTIPPIGTEYPAIQVAQQELNKLIASNAKETPGVSVVDTYHTLVNSDGLLRYEYDCGDGLHLSIDGYKRMGEKIWEKGLRPLLEELV
jgi:lysophospholipase L1-like esterase